MIEERKRCEHCKQVIHRPINKALFTNSEIPIIRKVYEGMTNKEIANAFFVAEKTIKFHLTNIYRKARVKTRYELIFECSKDPSLMEEGRQKTKWRDQEESK